MSGIFAGRPALLGAVAAGVTVIGIDLAGLTGANFFWGALEFICGCTAGAGLAACWISEPRTAAEKAAAGFLLCCHIFSFWLWVPFAAALICRNAGQTEPDSQWVRRYSFGMLAVTCCTGGYGFFYWGWSSPQPDIPVYQTAAGVLAAIAVPLLAGRFILQSSWRDAWRITCRFLALYSGVLLLCSFVKLNFRQPYGWYIYAGMMLICAAAAWGGRRKLSMPGIRKTVWFAWCTVLLATTGYMVLDCCLDARYFGNESTQTYYLSRFRLADSPILDACRKYRTKYNAWPEKPDQLYEFLKKSDVAEVYITGCHTAPNGDFRIFLKRQRRIWVMAYCFHADGRESWEYAAPDHPQRKPGDRRWKHYFPYTD